MAFATHLHSYEESLWPPHVRMSSLFHNFVTVRPALENALSDGAEEAGTKVRLLIPGNAITITNRTGLRLMRYKIC